MRNFTANPYYNPEDCGLQIVSELGGYVDYEYRIAVVWGDVETKKLYYAYDSGCSCPVPFETYTCLDDFISVGLDDLQQLRNTVLEDLEYSLHNAYSDVSFEDVIKFIDIVREYLRRD